MAALTGMTIVFQAVPLEENLELQARLGFTATEVWKPHLGPRLGPRMLEEVARYARDIGIRLSALNSIGEPYFKPFTGESGYAKTLDGLKVDIEICHHLGIPTLAVWEGLPQTDRDLEWHLDVQSRLFGDALAFAGTDGIERIVVEPHPFTIGFTLGGLPELCGRVGTARFGLILDTCHLGVAFPREYLTRLGPLVPFVHHVHLGDSDLRTSELHYPPGRGVMDLRACVLTLRDGGFRGSIAWDLFSWPFPKRAVHETRAEFEALASLLDIGDASPGERLAQ
jgi:sugar phosphate isomerase/epimerase